MSDITIEIAQQDWMPGFGAYLAPDGEFQTPARIYVNVAATVLATATGELPKDEAWRVVMETIFHEIGHVIEHALELDFSEERVEAFVREYVKGASERELTLVACVPTDEVEAPE